jgi:hypothetical protein
MSGWPGLDPMPMPSSDHFMVDGQLSIWGTLALLAQWPQVIYQAISTPRVCAGAACQHDVSEELPAPTVF